jgi:hypothetical protein
MILNQNDLRYIFENQKTDDDMMKILLKPLEYEFTLSTVTGNGQFRITLDWEPKNIKSGNDVTFLFYITDIFLKNMPVAVSYELSLMYQDDVIFSTSGISTDVKDLHNKFKVFSPREVSGPVTLQFNNLNENSLARVGMSIVVDRITQNQTSIPEWVRNNAGWWSEGVISDEDFANGIKYLVSKGIISV